MFDNETLNFIKAHANDDVRVLALHARKYPLVDLKAAITQIAGRQMSKEKIPSWHKVEGVMYPRHLSLEQCSSETTARYKASLVAGETFVDLTGGFGIDCTFLAERFKRSVYVERQEELCKIALHNFPLLGMGHIEVVNQDSKVFLEKTERMDVLFIDPARRNEHGGKTISIADCEPDVSKLAPWLLNKAETVIIKLSPMLDLSMALRDLPQTHEVHVVSAGNECKELLFILRTVSQEEVTIHCVNLKKDHPARFSFTRKQESQASCVYTSEVGKYLYEPNASILKAGAYKCTAEKFNLRKLHPNSHLYTSDVEESCFPGRVFSVEEVFTPGKKELKEHLKGLSKANITVRNFPATVDELRKRSKLADGGHTYLFATTLANEKKMIIKCKKTAPPAHKYKTP